MKNKTFNIILVLAFILLIFSISLNLYSYISQPKFKLSDCEIFKNKGKQIDINDGGYFYPLDYKLCEYCEVKC